MSFTPTSQGIGHGTGNATGGVAAVRAVSQCSLLASAALVIAASAAHAEGALPGSQEPGAAGATVGEVVVTAQKRSENILDVPIAMSATSEALLKAQGIKDVQGLQAITPSMVFTNTGPFNQPYIRGVGSRLLQNGLDPSVATYLDGRYISRQSDIVFDLADIDRVEILKGPQGVLFGRNSSAGAIRIITRDVQKELGGYINGEVGNYNLRSFAGAVNVPLSDSLGVRVSGTSIQHDGYAHNINPAGRSDWNDKDVKAIRAKIKWEPSDIVSAGLTAGYSQRKDNANNGIVAAGILPLDTGIARGGSTGTNRHEVSSNINDFNNIRDFSSEADLGLNLKPFDVKLVSTYASLKNHLVTEGDGTSARLVDSAAEERTETISHEVDLTSKNSGPLTWVAGAYYFHDDTSYDNAQDTGGAARAGNGLQRVKTQSESVFGQAKYHLTDALSFTAGGRYTHETKDASLSPTRLPGATSSVATPVSGHLAFNAFTPTAILQYDVGSSMVYAKYARGFKSGGFNYPFTNGVPLRPEKLDMYELGYKGAMFERSLTFSTSAYYYKYSDLQVTTAGAGLNGTVVVVSTNAASATLYGLDADATWRATPELTFTGGLSLEHSEYDNFIADAKEYRAIATGVQTPGMIDLQYNARGHQLLRAPKFSGFVSANYEFSVPAGKIPVSLTYAYKGPFDFDFVVDPSSSALHQKGYGLLNARVAFTPNSGKWTVALWGDNLANTAYLNDIVAAVIGMRASYGAPRTYGVQLQYNF